MKKIHMIAAMLAILLPTMVFGWDASYYAKVTVGLTTASTGAGKVYAGNTANPSASAYFAETKSVTCQVDKSGTSGNAPASADVSIYLSAKAEYGFKFDGWYDNAGGTGTAKSSSADYSFTKSSSGKSVSEAVDAGSYYAKFVENTYYAVNVIKPDVGLTSYTITGPTGFDGSSLSNGGELTAYAGESYDFKCTVADGYEFVKWTVNGADAGTSTTLTKTFSSASTVQAVVNKLVTYYATCQTVPAGCSYKVGSTTVSSSEYQTSGYGTLTVNLSAPTAASGYMFAGWYEIVDGNKTIISTDASTSVTKKSDVTLGADFVAITAPVMLVTSSGIVDYDDFDAAFAAAKSGDKIKVVGNGTLTAMTAVAAGVTLEVASGVTLTVASGATLYIDGSVTVNGTISGTVSKCTKLIQQMGQSDGVPFNPYGTVKYWKTSITTPSISISSSATHTTIVNGLGQVFRPTLSSSAKLITCTIDASVAVNHIKSITGESTSVNVVNDTLNSGMVILLGSDCVINGGLTAKTGFRGVVDCAGFTCKTITSQEVSGNNGKATFLNCPSFTGSKVINITHDYFNCDKVTLSSFNAGGSPILNFYDCGTFSSPASFSASYSKGPTDTSKFNFYSGYYNSLTYKSCFKVYGGSYKSDPSTYIADQDNFEAVYDSSSKYYVLQEKTEVLNVAAINGTEYETLSAAIAAAGNGATISLIEGVDLTGTTVEVPSSKNITIALDKHTITGGKIVNRGTLLITDITVANESNVKCDIENYGTLDLVFGTYTGAIANKAGTLTTHNGVFTGTLAKDGGTVNLKGGHFTADVTAFVTAEGYDVFKDADNRFCVCELPNGTMYDATVSGTAGYGATPYSDADFSVLQSRVKNGKTSRSEYSDANWKRLAQLLNFYQIFSNRGLDATIVFDRDVAKNSINLFAKSTAAMTVDFKYDLPAGQLYRALSEVVVFTYGYYAKTYFSIFDENIKSVAMAVSDKSGNNNGTVCKAMIELWKDDRAPDYSSTGHKITNTVYIAGQKLFTLGAGSNAAMIRPATGAATFYATLGAAMDAVADGGTVMLANDCATALPLTKAGTYTFDTMGFAHSDEVVLAEGLSIQSATPVTSSVESLIDGAVATTYVVVEESAATKVDVPTAVSGLVYDGTVKTGVAAGTGYTLSGNTATAAGTYTATATLAANYAWSDDSTGTKTIEWSIGKATVAVTAEAKTQVYGAETVALTYTAGDLVAGNSFSGSLAREAGDGVGTYAITQGTLSAGDNYTINFTGANYTITAIKIAVPTAVSGLTYDGTEQTGVMAGTGYTLSGNTATAAGTYTATATLAANYAWSDDSTGTKTIEWSIAAKAATITVASASKVYGEADPAFTGTVEGLVNANDLGTITYVRTGTDANVGTYNGVLTANYTPNGNYAVTVVPAALTITAAKATVPTAVSGLIYDGTEKTGVAAGTGYTLSDNTATAAGTYTATATLAANYVWSDGTTNAKSVEWSIGKATVAVTAEAKTQVYGAEAVALTYTAGDLVAGNSFSGSLAREAGDGVGTYAITQGTLSAGDNYTIHFTGANYTITAAKVSVPTAVANLTYDGTEKTGVAGGTGYTLSGNTATAAGTYTATATLVANYVWSDDSTGTKTIEWSIGKATVAVTAEAKTQVYGAEALALTYTAGDFVAGNSFSGSLAREAGDGVGTYAITQGTLSAGDNYTINFTGANYTITAAKVAVPTAASGLVYDGTEKTGVAAGTGYTLSGTTAATEAGTYTATATLEANYEWTDGTTDPKTITWSIDDAELHVTGIVPGTLRFTSVKASGRKVTVTFEFTPNGKNADDYRLIYKTAIDSKETFVSDIADVTVIDGDANSRTAIAEVILPEACEPQAFVTGLDFTEEE